MGDVLVLVESNTTGTGRLFAECARALGLEPLLLSSDARRYDFITEFALPVHACDTETPAAVIAACRLVAREHRLVGVTSSSEFSVAIAAQAARALDLPGEDPKLVSAARDKSWQRERFAACGVASPRHHTATTVADALAAAREIGLPVVLKPPTRSGSLGVRRCNSPFEVAAQAEHLLSTLVDERGRPLPSRLLVEEYLAGPEFSVELLGGQPRAVVAKRVDESCGFLETGHDLPAEVGAATATALRDTASAAAVALGLNWGAVHVEMRVVRGHPIVVEANPRLAGGMIPLALQACTGENLIAELVARTAGRPAPLPGAALDRTASIRFLMPTRDGTVRVVPDASVVRSLEGVVAAAVTARQGQQIVRQGAFLDRLGYVIACGADGAQAAARAEFAAELLGPDITGIENAVAGSTGGDP